MIDLKTEDDLWRLFGGQDHREPGIWRHSFEYVWNVLHDQRRLERKDVRPAFPLTDKTRLYLLVSRGRTVRIDQGHLFEIGKAMPDCMVQYVGVVETPSAQVVSSEA